MTPVADLGTLGPALWAAVAVIGLCVGSFLNVVIHRLPRMLDREWRDQCAELRGEAVEARPPFNLLRPRSRCPQCDHPISAWQNIPLISYALLRGRCAHCHARIPARYPIVETGAAVLAIAAALRFGVSPQAAAICVLLWALLALAVIDLDTQLLPDNITQPLLWIGLIVNAGGLIVPLPDALWGAVAGYLSLWLVYWGFRLLTGREGMGYGDFKLLAALGAWLGWLMLPVVILLSSVVGAVVGIALIAFGGRNRSIPIPFGPYLAGAGALAVFFGPALVRAYLG